MSEQTRKKIVYVALGLAIVWGGYNLFYKKDKESTPVESGISMVEATALAAGGAAGIFYVDNPDRFHALPWGHDPFKTVAYVPPDSSRPESGPTWRLSGIVFSPDNPVAIINSRMVRVGDAVDGASVVEISPRSVTLKQGERTFKLTVNRG